ncbi:DinI-like family protein [Enterobacter pseudoroggenkampii]|uniref:DinI-like family protein n=1 Tax=Enterobacter pseudoroggenkampii TaxID=2996112 RepID=UPI003EBA5BAB
MKIELTIDCMKKLPDGAIPALVSELLKRLSKEFDDCQFTIRRASNDGLTVLGATRKRSNTSCRRLGKARTSGFINRVNFTGAVSKSIAVCVPLAVPDYCLPRQ